MRAQTRKTGNGAALIPCDFQLMSFPGKNSPTLPPPDRLSRKPEKKGKKNPLIVPGSVAKPNLGLSLQLIAFWGGGNGGLVGQ